MTGCSALSISSSRDQHGHYPSLDYASIVQSNGGKVDSLLSAMRTKLDQLKAAG